MFVLERVTSLVYSTSIKLLFEFVLFVKPYVSSYAENEFIFCDFLVVENIVK